MTLLAARNHSEQTPFLGGALHLDDHRTGRALGLLQSATEGRDGDRYTRLSWGAWAYPTEGLARIVYFVWVILCDHGPETGALAQWILGRCATRRGLAGGRWVAYFLPSANKSLIWGMRPSPSRYYNPIIVRPDAL